MKREEISQEAKEIQLFNNNIVKGGNVCSHSTSVYGKVLKYILYERDWTFEYAGKLLGMTGQSVNYIVNRMNEKSFNRLYIAKICRQLGIDFDYFCQVSEELKKI